MRTGIISEINLIIFCSLLSGQSERFREPLHSDTTQFRLDGVHFFATVGADLQLPAGPSDGLTYPGPHQHHSQQAFMTRWLRLYRQEGSKRGGRYSIKTDQTVFKLNFYSDAGTSFTQDSLPFFCQKLRLCT